MTSIERLEYLIAQMKAQTHLIKGRDRQFHLADIARFEKQLEALKREEGKSERP